MKVMMDAARLAEELRTEQEVAMATERDRKLLEAQVKDLVARCDEAETNALKVCKREHDNKTKYFRLCLTYKIRSIKSERP